MTVDRISHDDAIARRFTLVNLAWERQLRPTELLAVSAYVAVMLDSDPPNPRPPQGVPTERQPLEGAAAATTS